MPDQPAAPPRPEPGTHQLTHPIRRVAVIGSPDKPGVIDTLTRVQSWLAPRADVVFSAITYESDKTLAARPDLLMVLGGDGTLIAAVHGLRERQVPIVGVNLGKLGYLADFTIEELEREGEFLFSGQLPVTRRTMMDVRIEHGDGRLQHGPAVNDCVVLAGPQFHMIQMIVTVDDDEVADIRGDGLIIATPSGSTAHNLAAGGPIVEPTGAALILTPICPHALTYRPLVLDAGRRLAVRLVQGNDGTTAATDGRILRQLRVNDQIIVTRYVADFLLVRNPRHSEWHALRRKLRWGEGPNMH